MIKTRKTATIWIDHLVAIGIPELASLIAKELDWPRDPLAEGAWVGPDGERLELDWEPVLSAKRSTLSYGELRDGQPVLMGTWSGTIVYERQDFIRVRKDQAGSELIAIIKTRKGAEPLGRVVERLAREILATAKSLKE